MCDCGKTPCACIVNAPTPEHTKIRSRTTGRLMEIPMPPEGDGLVPRNPFVSALQSRFAHANPSKFGGAKGIKEWESSTNYKNLPERAKHLKK